MIVTIGVIIFWGIVISFFLIIGICNLRYKHKNELNGTYTICPGGCTNCGRPIFLRIKQGIKLQDFIKREHPTCWNCGVAISKFDQHGELVLPDL